MIEKVTEALRNTIANLEADVARLQSALRAYDAYASRDYWIWQGDETDQPQSLGAQMHVVMNGSQVLDLLADRDEGDRRAGAAERKLARALEAAEARSSWLRTAKAQAGYDDRVSFDVVWAETLAKANQFSRYSREHAAARQEETEEDPPAREGSDWSPPSDYDRDGSVAAMARRAATQAQSSQEGCANWPRCGCQHPVHDCSIGPVPRLSNTNKGNAKDDKA